MFTSDTLADAASAILIEKTKRRLKALLAKHGVSDPGELPRALQAQILQRAIVETAAANFPTANLNQLDHGFRSFANPACVPAWDRVRLSTGSALTLTQWPEALMPPSYSPVSISRSPLSISGRASSRSRAIILTQS
jgi:hypothetical protein